MPCPVSTDPKTRKSISMIVALQAFSPRPADSPPRLVLLAVAAVLAPVTPVIAAVIAAVAPVVAPVAPLVHAVGDDHGTADGGHGPSAASV
jgi:hypothetical protein